LQRRQREQRAHVGLRRRVALVGAHQHLNVLVRQIHRQRRPHRRERHQRPAPVTQARHQPLLDAALPGAHAAPRQDGGRVQADRVKGFGGLHAANSSGRGDGRRDALKTRAASFTRGAL